MPPEAVRAGAFYTLEKPSPKAVFSMHGASNEEKYVEFAKAAKDAGVRAAVGCAENGGDPFLYSNGGLKRLNRSQGKPEPAAARRGGVPGRS